MFHRDQIEQSIHQDFPLLPNIQYILEKSPKPPEEKKNVFCLVWVEYSVDVYSIRLVLPSFHLSVSLHTTWLKYPAVRWQWGVEVTHYHYAGG